MIGSNGLDLKRCVACPYCLVMLGDAVSAKKAAGQAKDTLEVIDVAQLLARSVSTTANDGSPAAADGTATATDEAKRWRATPRQGKRRDGNQHPSQADSLMPRSNQ
jgi:hypothetical protein